jgi:plasmid maintenance system antidote protein VapI
MNVTDIFMNEIAKIAVYVGKEPQVWKPIRKERKLQEQADKEHHEAELKRLKGDAKHEDAAVRGLLKGREKLMYKSPSVTLKRT